MNFADDKNFIAYNAYRYIFPPRAEHALAASALKTYDNGTYLAQPKLNGDAMMIFTNGKEFILKNRHKEDFKKGIRMVDDLKRVYRETLAPGNPTNKWMILIGEYMVKSKFNADEKLFNEKFVIWDIICFDGKQLIGSTFEERVKLLDELYGKSEVALTGDGAYVDKFLYATNMPNIYRVRTFADCFETIFNDLVMVGVPKAVAAKWGTLTNEQRHEYTEKGMYEGLVLKRAGAQLQNGLSENNNSTAQLKFRKPTKNYAY